MQLPAKFPRALVARLEKFLTPSDVALVLAAFQGSRSASFRINTLKSDVSEITSALSDRSIEFSRFKALKDAYIVPREHEYSLKGSQVFYDGKIYVQGITSQVPAHFLGVRPGFRVLDVCAAPGSKTTQIAALMDNEGTIVALEKSPIRYDKLVHNISLQGASSVECVREDALLYLADENIAPFDAILLDAPCSAEGRIDLANEKSFGFWSVGNTLSKSELQYSLLFAAAKKLKKGGTLVYSTCTLAPEENEWVVSRLLRELQDYTISPIVLDIPEARPGIPSFQWLQFVPGIEGTLRILPSAIMEWFYVAKLTRK